MYIFSQKEDLENCEVVNNETLKIQHKNYEKVAVIQELPVKYLVFQPEENGNYNIDNQNYKMTEAEYVYIETHITNTNTGIKAESSIKNLIETFGNKKAKEIYQNIENNPTGTKQPKQIFTYHEQILPNFINTDDIENIYSLPTIFDSDLLSEFTLVDYDQSDLHESLQKYYNNDKLVVLILDCFYKVLLKPRIHSKYIDEQLIYGCSCFGAYIEPHLYKGYFTDLGRDKMVAIAYILILMLNGYNVLMEDVPMFGCESGRVAQIMKTIGCVYNKKTMKWKLSHAPKSEVMQKRGGMRGH